jgi:hypothetical protein
MFAFAIVGPRAAGRGAFNVYVDGIRVTPTAVSEASTTSASRRVLVARTLPQGTHTVEVRAVGNGRVDLDTILVLTSP